MNNQENTQYCHLTVHDLNFDYETDNKNIITLTKWDLEPNYEKNPLSYNIKAHDTKKFICHPYKKDIQRIISSDNNINNVLTKLGHEFELYIGKGDFIGADSCRKGMLSMAFKYKKGSSNANVCFEKANAVSSDPRFTEMKKMFVFLKGKYPSYNNK